MKYLGATGPRTTGTVGELSITIVTSKDLAFLRVFFIFFNMDRYINVVDPFLQVAYQFFELIYKYFVRASQFSGY